MSTYVKVRGAMSADDRSDYMLTREFGRGFSLANFKSFRQFYLNYLEGRKSYALRSLLSWTHHRLMISPF